MEKYTIEKSPKATNRFTNQGRNTMVKEVQQRREELQAAFSSEEQKRYWVLWLENQGSTARVATICGVTRLTVQHHIKRTARSLGFEGVKQARKHYNLSVSEGTEHAEVESADLKKLLEMQGYRCALSGVRLEPRNAEVDHKTPLSRGGTNDLGNLQWIDRNVNRAKGAMDNEEFIAMCKQIAKL